MNYKPTFLDLFAGAGGASYGLESAGFKSVGAIEIDKWASNTYKLNHPNSNILTSDIVEVSDAEFKSFKGVDLIVGGPPCQGFSIAASNRRVKDDKRNLLYLHFVRAVQNILPTFIIVENVKEILKFTLNEGTLLLHDFVSKLETLGYHISYRLINAKYLGVPQDRIRFFLVGSRKNKISLNDLDTQLSGSSIFPGNELLTLNDAISDLPEPINKIDNLPYNLQIMNEYQRKMREESNGVYNHEPMNHTKRLVERFKHIPIEGNTLNTPIELRNRVRGNASSMSSKIYHQNHRRLNPDKPCKTITASFYSSFLHPFQHRNLTVREAARIQGFPDRFIFTGKRTTLSKKLLMRKGIQEDLHLDQFNQVGNAVSPIVAEVLGKLVLKNFK